MVGDQHRGVVAQNIMSLRSFREGLFPKALFDEYAWNMLLLLFIGLAKNETISESLLIQRADVTTNAGRRWIAHLVGEGQIEARSDGEDVFLTTSAIETLRAFLDSVADLPWHDSPEEDDGHPQGPDASLPSSA